MAVEKKTTDAEQVVAEKATPAKTSAKTTETTKVTTKEVKPRKLRISQIDKNIEVGFKNNTNGGLTYVDPKNGYVYRLGEFGDEDFMTFDEVLTMKNSSKKFFSEYWVILTEVPEGEYTVDELIDALGLSNLYAGENKIVRDLDGFIKGSFDNFKKTLPKVDSKIQELVIKRVQHLYKRHEIKNIDLVQYLIEFTEDKELFI